MAEIASPRATGGGGTAFEFKVQAWFLATMLLNGRFPCLPGGKADFIRFQARQLGYATDDILVRIGTPSGRLHRLAAQIKSGIAFTSNPAFRELIIGAWTDFESSNIFNQDDDVLAIISGPGSKSEISHFRPLLEWSRSSSSAEEYFNKISTPKFASERKRNYLSTIESLLKEHIGIKLSRLDLWRFLKCFHWISFDFDDPTGRDISNILAFLKMSMNTDILINPEEIWSRLIKIAMDYNPAAGTLTRESLFDKLGDCKAAFSLMKIGDVRQAVISVGGGLLSEGNTDPNDSQVGRNSQVAMKALSRVRRFSDIAARDAGFIISNLYGHQSDEVRLDQNLYVRRSIEEDIHKILKAKLLENDTPIMVVSGEAGFGKTSLLWQLHRTLDKIEQWEPWFIKSTYIAMRDTGRAHRSTKQHLDVNELELAIKVIQAQGKQPIILLDTADLLLGNENDRYFLIEALIALREMGCAVIAATRPQEAAHLRLPEMKRLDLRDYNDGELQQAVTGHVLRFYTKADKRGLLEHIETIRNAVSRGLPIREVCTNPLTLRMLFTLYAPEKVNMEINIFKLYEDYWDHRVVKDYRAGSDYPQEEGMNLASTATAVALIMLAEGLPEVDARLVERTLPQAGITDTELKQLISRGIIHKSEGRTIRFFHQTFFEHSAARCMLMHFREEVIPIIEERMRSRPNELFINPIFEQVLLLCEAEPAPIRSKAGEAFINLINSASVLARSSAIYVYAHQQGNSEKFDRVILRRMAQEETGLVIRFLAIAHNMSKQRLQSLLNDLDIIWERHKWEEQYHILLLLERLAARDPELVLTYLNCHQIAPMVQKMPPLGYQSFLRTVVILANDSKSNVRDSLVRTLSEELARSMDRNLQACIVDTLYLLARLPGTERVRRHCEAGLKNQPVNLDFGNSLLVSSMGSVYALDWAVSKQQLDDIFSEIHGMDDRFFLKAGLHGLSRFLLLTDIDKAKADAVWRHYCEDPDVSRKWLWSSIVMPRLFRGSMERDDPPKNLPRITRYFREYLADVIANEAECFGNEKYIGGKTEISPGISLMQVQRSLSAARLPSGPLLELLKGDSLASSEPWLSEKGFIDLLPEAFIAGHTGACRAIQLLIKAPEKYPAKILKVIGGSFEELIDASTEGGLQNIRTDVFESAITFFVRTGAVSRLSRIIETNQAFLQVIIRKFQPDLVRLRQRICISSSGLDRRKGYALWISMLQVDLDTVPPMNDLLAAFANENDQQAKASIAFLIGQSAARGLYDKSKAVEFLWAISEETTDENLREKALAGLFDAINQSEEDPAAFAELALSAALAKPTHAYRLSQIGRLIERLIPDNSELSANIIEKLLLAPETSALGRQAKRSLITRLRQPVRDLFLASSTNVLERLLYMVPKLDSFLSRILIDAACHDAFFKTIHMLDRLLDDPAVSGRTKELIRRHKYLRERTRGGTGWPELYTMGLKWFNVEGTSDPVNLT